MTVKFIGYEPATDLFIKDMSRRQNIQKNTKSKGYEPAMVNIATAI